MSSIWVTLGLDSWLSLYCPARREDVFAYSTKRFRNFSRTSCSSVRSTFIHNGKRKAAKSKLRSRFAEMGRGTRVLAIRSAEQTQRSILTDTNSLLQIRRALNLHGRNDKCANWGQPRNNYLSNETGNVSKEISPSPTFPEIESIRWK